LSSPSGYPFALKIAAGMVNAVNGKFWTDELDVVDQDYIEVPGQPWLDGFCVAENAVRQFVAMPLGQGYTAEEQVTGNTEHGGMQLLARPLRGELWERRKAQRGAFKVACAMQCEAPPPSAGGMGLAPGGSIRQQINKAQELTEDWEPAVRSRCFVHISNSLAWRAATGGAARPAADGRRLYPGWPALVRLVRRSASAAQ
jgi:hypothetical protein